MSETDVLLFILSILQTYDSCQRLIYEHEAKLIIFFPTLVTP